MIRKSEIRELRRRVLIELKDLGAYIYCEATTGSIYIKFEDARLCSLRIGDHDGKEKYKYKWNLRFDIKDSYETQDGGVRRFYFPTTQISKFIARLRKYQSTIQEQDEREWIDERVSENSNSL